MTESLQKPSAAEVFLSNLLEQLRAESAETNNDMLPMLLMAQRFVEDLTGTRDALKTAQGPLLDALVRIEDIQQEMLKAAATGKPIGQKTADEFDAAKAEIRGILGAVLDPVKAEQTPAPSPSGPAAHRDHGSKIKQVGSKVG